MLDRLLRKLRMSPVVAVSVPCSTTGFADMVVAFTKLLGESSWWHGRIVRVQLGQTTIAAAVAGAGMPGCGKRLLLLAHPHPNGNGLLAELDPVTGADIILLRWWQGLEEPFDLVYAHVCNGSELLGRPLWQSVFPNWVSYSRPVRALVDPAKASRHWHDVLNGIGRALEQRRGAHALGDTIRGVFHTTMGDIADSYSVEAGDKWNLIFIQEHLEALTTSAVGVSSD